MRRLPTLVRSSNTLVPTHRKALNAFSDEFSTLSICSRHTPNIGVRTSDPTIRRLTTAPYPFLVFYEVSEEEIVIHAIRHTARDPSGMPGSN
jgi:hypothetical protein